MIIIRKRPYGLEARGPVSQAGERVIDTTSRAAGWSRGLSPMLLGPVQTPAGEARTVEQAWQYSKCYAAHLDARLGDLVPGETFRAWRAQGFAAPRAARYPMGKGAKPQYSLWGEERLGYLDARARIYVPVYAGAAQASAAWSELQREYQAVQAAGERLVLLDFDAWPQDLEMNARTWKMVQISPQRPMGHAFVLGALLLGLPMPGQAPVQTALA